MASNIARQAQLQKDDLEALAAWATDYANNIGNDETFSVATGELSGMVQRITYREGRRELLFKLSLEDT